MAIIQVGKKTNRRHVEEYERELEIHEYSTYKRKMKVKDYTQPNWNLKKHSPGTQKLTMQIKFKPPASEIIILD